MERSAAYNEHFQKKLAQEAWDKEKLGYGNTGGVEDLSGEMQPGVVASGAATPAQMQQNTPAPTSELSQLGSLATTGGAATANPYIAGAGLALQTAGMIQQAKQNQRNAQYTAEVNRVNARQQAINNMAQIGQGLKA